MTNNERKHLEKIKGMACGVCSAPAPSDAHHLLEGGRRVGHFAVIPLCRSCHQDNKNGIHGEKNMWRVMRKTEMTVLAETIEAMNK